MRDQQTFRNQDLVLRVSPSVNPARFDITKYEPFLDALCGSREYQKEAIRTVLRYLLGGRYPNLRALAEENFHSNETLRDRYGTFAEMERHLQLPDQLACSVDLATATGKSYVIYGIARIMLAEGAVDRVLVLCPSRTIEEGLLQKFRALSADITLRDLLPENARVRNPHIINGSESIVDGTICVENFHATLEHVKSSIRDSLRGKGERTLVLNDEVHHVYNKPIGQDSTSRSLKRWKEFLLDPDFGFRYIVGFSGTCYIENDYFADVVYRYSLREAIEQGFAKSIDYVAEDTSQSQYEKFQKIYDNHREHKEARYRKVKPLTILVTRDIAACKRLTEDLVEFLAEQEHISREEAEKKVLIVTSAQEHQANVRALADVDLYDNPVEWITSVSMLTEGWDVQNVFQIVPHEERAFNSKLLIAQVLGRGLRIPDAYRGERPVVTVFNHDAWSSRIRHLVDEVMEVEKRLYSYPVVRSPDYHFTLHQLDYSKTQTVEEFEQVGEYDFSKGFVTLISQVPAMERETTYERAVSGVQRTKKTLVQYRMYTVDEVAEQIHYRLASIDLETEGQTNYAERYNLDWLKAVIRESLRRVGESENLVSEENRQRLYAAFGTLRRGVAKRVRYLMTPQAVKRLSTADRPRDSVGVGALRRGEVTVFADEHAFSLSDEEVTTLLEEVRRDDNLPRAAWHYVENTFLFKAPLNIVLAERKPERDFVRHLLKPENAAAVDAWIKSTDQGFYEIEYAWRKGEHPKRGYFNPDFFIKKGKHILVIEIKGDEEIDDPSDENKGKYRYARQHFETLNQQQNESRYFFHFLSPRDYHAFFRFLRDGNYESFVSTLDAALGENGQG
ncbi:MAG: DEAD/DEAH box helicase family protein [candidate division KSB1 bacterium]|nr:DEAD/DEAH box helicase family protein [candidate division KSB1 bacterium]